MRRLSVRTRTSRKSFAFVMVIAMALTAATGLAVYNLDSAYVANKFNLVSYVPDKLSAGGDTTIIVMAMDDDGKPLASKPIDVVLTKDNYSRTVWTGVTDDSGFATPIFESPADSGSLDLVVKSGTESITTRTVVDDTVRIIITTDKPIYQPGQMIHMRILSYAGAQPLPQDSPIIVEVIDPNGDKIFKKQLTANDYGIASYDLALSDQMIEGKYTIKATSGQRTVSKEIIVKQYVLPKFRVSVLGLKDWYTVSETIQGSVDAEYFFGQYVQGTVTVQANMYYGVWTEIYNKTGDLYTGNFAFTIPAVGYAIGMNAAGGNGYLQLNVSVTDTGAHTEKRSKIIPIAPSPVSVSVLTDSCVMGMESTFYVIARTPDGKAIANASAYAYLYDEDGHNLRSIGPVATDSRGLAEISFDYNGEASGNFVAYQGSRYGSANVVFGDGVGVKILPDKSAYNIGEVGNFTIVYSGPSFTSNVYYDVVSRGYVVSRGVLELVNGRAQIQVQMVPEMQPFTQVRVYKIEKTLDVSRDAVTFTVGDSMALSVEISTDNDTYLPRDDVTFDFNVTTGGQPILAALGISVVDEAVYEVGTMFQGFEELIFGLDEDFIQPQYQVISYIFADSGSLPSESEKVVDEIDTARMASTWPENEEYAQSLRDQAIENYWLAVMVVAAIGVIAGAGWSVRNGRKAVPIALICVVSLGLVTFGVYTMMLGFGGSSSSPTIPRAPGEPNWQWELKDKAAFGGAEFDDPLLDGGNGLTPTQMSYGSPSTETTIVRNYFPETWYWNPCLVTGDDGRASVTLTAPDSITSWNVDAIASTVDGMVGSGTASMTVFKSFFIDPDIPVSVVKGDRFDLKVQIYNYNNVSQSVDVTLADEAWFDLLSPATQSILVPANYVSYVNFTIVATSVGWHTVMAHGTTGTANDTVEKPMRIVPDGTKQRTLFNGEVENGTVSETLTLLQDRILGSENAWVKLQGSVEAVLLEGVESYINFVTGCGEQSLSTLSIDILAYDTVKQLGTSPEKLFEYESIVNQGLMHELTYLEEANNGKGRGIVWFPGDQDVHPWLTSWGLIAFQDAINAGFGLDEDIIKDMQSWLISIQNSDGSWQFPDWGIYEFNNPLLKSKKIAATAYIARALLRSGVGPDDPSVAKAMQYVEDHIQEVYEDAYSLGISLVALQLGGGSTSVRSAAAAELDSLKQELNDTYFWSSDTNLLSDNGGGFWVGGWGCSARIIETTGYAIMALHGEHTYQSVVQGGVKYLLDHRSELGGWSSTQDTIVAFHALKETTGASAIESIFVQVSVEGVEIYNMTMDDFNKDVTYYVDLRPYLQNTTNVSVTATGVGSLLYSIYLEQYVPWPETPDSSPYLTLTVTYDTTTIQLDDTVTAHMYLLYNGAAPTIKMMLVDLRSPMGLRFNLGDFDELRTQGVISSYDSNPRQVLVYLTDVQSGVPIEFDYSLVAEMPIRSTVQDISAWDMYDPNNLRSEVLPVVFEVT